MTDSTETSTFLSSDLSRVMTRPEFVWSESRGFCEEDPCEPRHLIRFGEFTCYPNDPDSHVARVRGEILLSLMPQTSHLGSEHAQGCSRWLRVHDRWSFFQIQPEPHEPAEWTQNALATAREGRLDGWLLRKSRIKASAFYGQWPELSPAYPFPQPPLRGSTLRWYAQTNDAACSRKPLPASLANQQVLEQIEGACEALCVTLHTALDQVQRQFVDQGAASALFFGPTVESDLCRWSIDQTRKLIGPALRTACDQASRGLFDHFAPADADALSESLRVRLER